MKYKLLASWLLAFVAHGAVIAADDTAERPKASSVSLALIDEHLPARLEIGVVIDDRSVEEVWDSTFDTLFRFADANGNGELEDSEFALLPSPQGLRLALGSGFAPPIGQPVSPEDIRSDASGRITRHQVAEYYCRHGVGMVSIGVGQLKSAPVLAQALLAALDSDRDGSVSNSEWAGAAETLMRLDTNDDELVGAGEIVPDMLYPGAAGTMLLRSPTVSTVSRSKDSSAMPVVLLSNDLSDESWMRELIDRGVNSNADRLRNWRREKAAARWDIHIDRSDAAASSLDWSSNELRWDGWLAAGSLEEANRHVREHVTTALETSTTGSGRAGRERALDWLIPLADRNRDGNLSRAEVEQWCDVQSNIVRGQVLVTILWGGGLFEILDRNHDGALAIRELRGAWQAISQAGCVVGGRFCVAEVPQVTLAIASQGYPQTITEARPSGPNWARAMDRNADGDISRKEFSGPLEAFQRMDIDRDGLVDAREATLQ